MTGAVVDRLRQAQPGDHFLWRVGSAGNHVDTASAVVAEARARGRRVLVFGPTDGPVLAALWASADAVVDPAASLMADGRVSPAPV
ncbi:MAG TPA: hypothetical protein VE991_08760, partial [Acidimicrobiales bacterium]|nr:hypothetical protein [Acidimicrobiales bacterium]